MPALFFPGFGGRYPRAKTERDKLARKLMRLLARAPDPAVRAEVLAAVDNALAALDRQAVTEKPVASPAAASPVASTPALFFTDSYAPRPPRSERERIEREIYALQARRWSDPGDRAEIEGLIEELERQLRALGSNR